MRALLERGAHFIIGSDAIRSSKLVEARLWSPLHCRAAISAGAKAWQQVRSPGMRLDCQEHSIIPRDSVRRIFPLCFFQTPTTSPEHFLYLKGQLGPNGTHRQGYIGGRPSPRKTSQIEYFIES